MPPYLDLTACACHGCAGEPGLHRHACNLPARRCQHVVLARLVLHRPAGVCMESPARLVQYFTGLAVPAWFPVKLGYVFCCFVFYQDPLFSLNKYNYFGKLRCTLFSVCNVDSCYETSAVKNLFDWLFNSFIYNMYISYWPNFFIIGPKLMLFFN